MRKVWIEAALNGSWGRALQPGIPDTVETIVAEGVACARAGATIVHVHAYDGGAQTYDWQVYARSSKAFVTRSMCRSIPPIRLSSPQAATAARSPTPRPDLPTSKNLPRAACWILPSSTPVASI